MSDNMSGIELIRYTLFIIILICIYFRIIDIEKKLDTISSTCCTEQHHDP